MSLDLPTMESFLKDVQGHTMKVLVDNGVYRHLRFSRDGSSCYHFEIVTWPGYLAYVGDMGAFTFRRLEDMFEFFRVDLKAKHVINPSYWAEKVVAEEKGSGIESFSVEKFRQAVFSDVRSHLELEENAEIPEEIQDELGTILHSVDEWECVTSLRDYDGDLNFNDFWEHDVQEYSYSYIWCCYALVWAISMFDIHKGKLL